jgi:hypothetical protein
MGEISRRGRRRGSRGHLQRWIRGAPGWRPRTNAEPRARRRARERAVRAVEAQIRREVVGLVVEIAAIAAIGALLVIVLAYLGR